MAQKTIPELSESTSISDNYAFPMDSGIQSYKVLWSTIKSYIWNAVISTFDEALSVEDTDLLPMELSTGGDAGEIRKIQASTLKAYVTENALPPVGSVLPFFDFNGLVTYNSDVWKPINGATISDVQSPLNTVTLPNLTGRALIGYGTDGGSDMMSATWSASPVGNAGHLIDISHSHDLGSNAYAKFHFNSSYLAALSLSGPSGSGFTANLKNTHSDAYDFAVSSQAVSDGSALLALGGRTNTGATSSIDIRMRSIRCRWLVRYK